ncbi:hypothetical protein Pelo_17414 [Pelomyxa schiedti]|nr:hypothetical protein Pelo_17414 [Pelomyxa schiedti]
MVHAGPTLTTTIDDVEKLFSRSTVSTLIPTPSLSPPHFTSTDASSPNPTSPGGSLWENTTSAWLPSSLGTLTAAQLPGGSGDVACKFAGGEDATCTAAALWMR